MPFHHYALIAGTETFHTPFLMLHGSGRTEQDMVIRSRNMIVGLRTNGCSPSFDCAGRELTA